MGAVPVGNACGLFTMLGVAGVGKSRLVSEFVNGVDARIVTGRCLSYGEGITYWPVVETVKQVLGGEDAPNGAIAALLGSGDAAADDIAFAVRRLLNGERDVIRRCVAAPEQRRDRAVGASSPPSTCLTVSTTGQ